MKKPRSLLTARKSSCVGARIQPSQQLESRDLIDLSQGEIDAPPGASAQQGVETCPIAVSEDSISSLDGAQGSSGIVVKRDGLIKDTSAASQSGSKGKNAKRELHDEVARGPLEVIELLDQEESLPKEGNVGNTMQPAAAPAAPDAAIGGHSSAQQPPAADTASGMSVAAGSDTGSGAHRHPSTALSSQGTDLGGSHFNELRMFNAATTGLGVNNIFGQSASGANPFQSFVNQLQPAQQPTAAPACSYGQTGPAVPPSNAAGSARAVANPLIGPAAQQRAFPACRPSSSATALAGHAERQPPPQGPATDAAAVASTDEQQISKGTLTQDLQDLATMSLQDVDMAEPPAQV